MTAPVSAPAAAASHYAQQQALTATTVAQAAALWALLDAAALIPSWTGDGVGAQLFTLLARAQRQAAAMAEPYVARMLGGRGGFDLAPSGRVVAGALAGVASDGRPLESLLAQPLVSTISAQAAGATLDQSMRIGEDRLTRIVGTQVADAGRVAESVATTVRPRLGYVRMVVPPACSRCIILAGKFYRWNDGFQRHPNCDCRHIPADEDTADEVTTDPRKLFDSMTREEQDRRFTKDGAQAIRDGADISQVVNARRGATGLSIAGRLTAEERRALRGGGDKRGRIQRTDVYGRPVFTTTTGTTRRGTAGHLNGKAPRLMPESIYELARDREDAVRLLRRFGYIT